MRNTLGYYDTESITVVKCLEYRPKFVSQRESWGMGICPNGDKKVSLKNGLAYFDSVTKKYS